MKNQTETLKPEDELATMERKRAGDASETEEFENTHSKLVEDNRRLAAELSEMRATISDRLNGAAAARRPEACTTATATCRRALPGGKSTSSVPRSPP